MVHQLYKHDFHVQVHEADCIPLFINSCKVKTQRVSFMEDDNFNINLSHSFHLKGCYC